MATTLRDSANALSTKLGGFISRDITINPDPEDELGMRSILTEFLYDPDNTNKDYAGRWAWIGALRDQRRIKNDAYSSQNYVVFDPPSEGTYRLVLYGWGTTKILGAHVPNSQIEDAIKVLNEDYFTQLKVTGTDRKIIKLPDAPIDIDITNGTIISQGGIARLEVTRGFSRPLRQGDIFDIHKALPVIDADEFTGLHSLINQALARLWIQDMFPITPNNQGIYEASTLSWIKHPDQIEAVYGPAEWQIVSTFTPPDEGSFTLTFHFISGTVTTAPILRDTMGSTSVIDAVNTAFGGNSLYTMVTDPGTLQTVFTRNRTLYASEKISATSGLVDNQRYMMTDPVIMRSGWSFLRDAPSSHLVLPGFDTSASIYLYGKRPGNTWVAPQTAYGVTSTAWEDSKRGLYNDYDMHGVNPDDLLVMAYYLATEHLASIGPQAETAYWSQKAHIAAIDAAHLMVYDYWLDPNLKKVRTPWGGKVGAFMDR